MFVVLKMLSSRAQALFSRSEGISVFSDQSLSPHFQLQLLRLLRLMRMLVALIHIQLR